MINMFKTNTKLPNLDPCNDEGSRRYWCSCGTNHALVVDREYSEKYQECSIWIESDWSPSTSSFLARLKAIWTIIRGGHLDSDGVILDGNQIEELSNFLDENMGPRCGTCEHLNRSPGVFDFCGYYGKERWDLTECHCDGSQYLPVEEEMESKIEQASIIYDLAADAEGETRLLLMGMSHLCYAIEELTRQLEPTKKGRENNLGNAKHTLINKLLKIYPPEHGFRSDAYSELSILIDEFIEESK